MLAITYSPIPPFKHHIWRVSVSVVSFYILSFYSVAERERERDRETEAERERDRDRDRQTERQTQRERERIAA